ncbi:MAG: hypothetical protein KDK54_19970 [Leptospiraceae bacterium]|nr:hypothetical protein [Leptospiraceae bacterium]
MEENIYLILFIFTLWIFIMIIPIGTGGSFVLAIDAPISGLRCIGARL